MLTLATFIAVVFVGRNHMIKAMVAIGFIDAG